MNIRRFGLTALAVIFAAAVPFQPALSQETQAAAKKKKFSIQVVPPKRQLAQTERHGHSGFSPLYNSNSPYTGTAMCACSGTEPDGSADAESGSVSLSGNDQASCLQSAAAGCTSSASFGGDGDEKSCHVSGASCTLNPNYSGGGAGGGTGGGGSHSTNPPGGGSASSFGPYAGFGKSGGQISQTANAVNQQIIRNAGPGSTGIGASQGQNYNCSMAGCQGDHIYYDIYGRPYRRNPDGTSTPLWSFGPNSGSNLFVRPIPYLAEPASPSFNDFYMAQLNSITGQEGQPLGGAGASVGPPDKVPPATPVSPALDNGRIACPKDWVYNTATKMCYGGSEKAGGISSEDDCAGNAALYGGNCIKNYSAPVPPIVNPKPGPGPVLKVCKGGQVSDGKGGCQCPAGQTWNGQACQPGVPGVKLPGAGGPQGPGVD